MTLRPDYGVYNYDRVTAARTRGNYIKERERERTMKIEGDRKREREGKGHLKHVTFN